MGSNAKVFSLISWWKNLSGAWQHALADNLELMAPPQIGDLERLFQLTELDLSGSAVDELSPLLVMPQLVKLDLSDTRVVDLSLLHQLPNLKELHMVCSQGINVRDLAQLKGLEVIDVSYPVVPLIGSISLLENLECLRELYCNACDLKDVIPVIGLDNLQTLSLSFNRIPSLEIKMLAELNPMCRILN